VTAPPIVIAHRGASGYLPEHTLAGKALAFGLGADFVEQDVVATRDAELVVLHDLYLDDVTDVAMRFPGRQRADGRYYVIDFDLAELRTLCVRERRSPTNPTHAKYPGRFPLSAALFGISTLDDELALVEGLNGSMGRRVGIYPEIKHPAWHRQHGIDLSSLLLAKLERFDYSAPGDAAYVQCFDAAELERVRFELGCTLPLVQLIETAPESAELLQPAGLRRVARYATGIGPGYRQLVAVERGRFVVADAAQRARDLGLLVHPYTFRRDDLPPEAATFEGLIELFLRDVRVDGLFCDHPDVAVRVRDSLGMDSSSETA
jgi:glycerophosphoryl diester phosphodiesterase